MNIDNNDNTGNTHNKSGALARLFTRNTGVASAADTPDVITSLKNTHSTRGEHSPMPAKKSWKGQRSTVMSTTRTSGRQLSERQGSGMSRRGRRFVAAVTAVMLALPVMGGAFSFSAPAFADDLTNTVPNEEAGGGSFYSNEIYTGFVPNNYTTEAVAGPSYGPYTVPGVLQSQSATSATSFAAGLPLGTIFIDQSKVGQEMGTTEVASTDSAIIAGLVKTADNRWGYDGTQEGAIKMKPGKINKLDGNLLKVTFKDAAILPNGERANLVVTYSNAQIVIDQRYMAAPDGKTYYEVKRWVDTEFANPAPADPVRVGTETFDGMPVFRGANGVEYGRKNVSGTNRYFRIYNISPVDSQPAPGSLTDSGRTHSYNGKDYPVYTDGTKEYILPDDEQYYHGAVLLAQGNAISYGGTDQTNFAPLATDQRAGVVPPEWASAAQALINGTSGSFGNSTNFVNSNVRTPSTGLTVDATYQVVNKDGTPAAGTFIYAVSGINLDRDPDTGTSQNNVGKVLWYTYTEDFGGENGKEHSFFSEAMEILAGQVSDYVYIRPNNSLEDNPDKITGVKGQYFWSNVSLHNGNIKFIGNGVNTPSLGGNDASYNAGFVTLANAATGFKIRATGHAGNGQNMNSYAFNSKQIWYRYTESTGKHGSIAVTSEGNFGGTLSDGGAVYKPEGTWDKGDEWDGNGGPSGIGEAATHVVAEGKTVTYTMTPDIGYKISKLWIGDRWNSDRSPEHYAEVTFDGEAIAVMKKGDTQAITMAAGNDGLLTYNEDGTYTLTLKYAEHDEAVHVEWEPTTADILVAKVWDDEDDKDGLRAAAYADEATKPRVKLQWFIGGQWEDVPADKLSDWTNKADPDVKPREVPDGKDASGKYRDGRYEINKDTSGKHPFTWEYLPVYSYDRNGVADRPITYRIVEVPDLKSSDYKDPEYLDAQSFTLDSSMNKSRDGFQLWTDGTTQYIKKGDGKYYEVDRDGIPGADPATDQPDPASLTNVALDPSDYYTVDKGAPYQTVDVKNEHKPNEIYIEFTKNWNDAAIQNMVATDGNQYARKDLHFTLHGTIGTNGSTKIVDLNGGDKGEDIVVVIPADEADGKAEAIGRVEGYAVVTDGSANYVLRNAGDGEQYYTYTANADGTYSYTVAAPQPTAADLNPVTGDGTYKIDKYNFGALIENLPTHSEGKLITYTLTETDSEGKTLDGKGWIATGGQLTPVYDKNGKLESYTTQFVNTPEIDDTTSPLPLTIQKKDKVTKGSLGGAVFTVYTDALGTTKASESDTEKIGGKTVYTDGTTKYVLQDDGGEDKYFAVAADGTVAPAAADPQPNPANLFESKTTTTETVEGQTVYTDGTTKYVKKADGKYYTYEDDGDGSYTYTEAANQNAGTMRQSQLKGAVDENEVVTNANGQVTINFNKPGTYYVRETKAPTGYEVDPKVYVFVVDEKLKSVTFKDVQDPERDWWEVIYELLFGNGTTLAENWAPTEGGKSGTLTVEDDPIRASILIDKRWDDNNNQDGLRGTGAIMPQVKLEKTTNPADETSWTPVNSQAVPAEDKDIPDHDAPITVDPDNYYTWGDLPAYENGKLIYYRVKEFGGTLPDGGVFLPTGDHPEDNAYAWTALAATGNEEKFNIANITDPANPTSRNRTVTVTNKHVPQTFTLNVSKDWADDDDDTSKRKTANITLYKTVDGVETVVETRTDIVPLDDKKKFTVFENLPVYENGKAITYRVEETAIDLYGTTYKRSYETNTAVVNGQDGDSVDASTVKRTFGPEKVGDYPVYTDESGNQYAYVTGVEGVSDGYYAVSGDAIDYDSSYVGDPSELTQTREETTEAEIEVKNAKLTEVTVEKTWFNGATENVIYHIYRTTSADPAVIDWEQAKGAGKASMLDDTKTVYNWTPPASDNDPTWELVKDEGGQPITIAFLASDFANTSEGASKFYTISDLPVANPDGKPYTYRVYELGSDSVDKFEANQVSNTKIENTNTRATDGIAHVNVVKELEGREWNNSDKFYFTIEPYEDASASVNYGHSGACGVDQDGDEITDCSTVPMPKDNNGNPKSVQEVKKSDDQVGAIGRNVGFTPITYTSTDVDMGKSAEYYYKVYEVYDAQGTSLDEATEHIGKLAGITYDGEVEDGIISDTFKPTEHFLKVVVTSDPNGVMSTALYWDGSDKPSAVPVYTNRYDASAKINAHIIKEVKGREIIGNDEFNFSISNIGGAPLRDTETGTATVVTGTHDAGSIKEDTGSKVTGTGAYNPVSGGNGNFRAIKSESTNWIKVGDLSQKTTTADGKVAATDTFIYRLTENAPDASDKPSVANEDDLNFDSRHIYVKIVATDNLDGTIGIQKTYWYDETCSSQPVNASVLVDSDGNIAPAGATSDGEDGDGNKLYHDEPAAIFTNTQTIDIPVVKEWKKAPAVEDVTLRLQRKLIPLSDETGLTYDAVEGATGDWKDVSHMTAKRGDFVNTNGTPKYDDGSEDTASKTYVNIEGFNKDLPKYVTENGVTYRAVYKLVEDNTSDAYGTTYRSKKTGAADTAGNQIFIDGETLVVTNTVTTTNEANIAAVKQLLGRQWLDSDDFEFTLEPAAKGTYDENGNFSGKDTSDEARAAVPMPKNNTDRKSETTGTGKDTVATTHAWDDANNANSIVVDQNGDLERLARFGAIDFDINDLTWVKDHYEGDFFYTMKEKVPEGATQNADGTYTKGGITYDKDSHTVHVKVTGNRTNQLYVQIAYDEKTVGDASTGAQFTPVYTNRYDAVGTVETDVDKLIMGRDWNDGETFDFTMAAMAGAPFRDGDESQFQAGDVEAALAAGKAAHTAEGAHIIRMVADAANTTQTAAFPKLKFVFDDLDKTVGTTGDLKYSDGSDVLAGMRYGQFMYVIEEVASSASDLERDTDTEYYQITVIDKGDGTLDTTIKVFEDRLGQTERPATSVAFVNQVKRDLAVTKAWDAPATSDVTLRLEWSTDGTTWNSADGTQWLAGFDSSKTIAQNAAGADLTVTWSGLPAYMPDSDDIDTNDKWVRYRVVEDSIAHVTTRYSTAAYADGDKSDNAKYSENAIATEAAATDTRVTQTYVTNFVEDLEGTASVNVVKQLIGRGWTDSDSFGFTITPKESKIGKETTATPAADRAMPMPMGTDDNGDPVVDNTATATKTGSRPVTVGEYNATFKDIVIKLSDLALNDKNIATGEFVYTIKEAIPDDATEITGTDGKKYYIKGNIKYTDEEHTVTIVATNDGTGKIDTTVSYDDRPSGDFVPVYTNEAIVPTPIAGSKTWVGGEEAERINANDAGVDALGITLQRKTAAATDWMALTADDADRELVVVWENNTGDSGYTVKAKKSATENVNPVLDTMDNDGYKYEYRIVENGKPADYTVSYTTRTITNDTITNTSTKKDSLKVTKTWADGDNAEGLRPDKVVVHLYKEVSVPAATAGDPDTTETIQVEVAKKEIVKPAGEAQNAWTDGVTWDNLPVYDAAGNKITYVVIEEAEFGYTTTYKALGDDYTTTNNSLTLDGNTTAAAQTIDVKNSLTPATDTVSVTKTWDDINNSDGERPEKATLKLYEYVWNKAVNATDYESGKYVKNTTPVKTIELDGRANEDTANKLRELAPGGANTWKGEFYGLPRTKNGKTVLYVVEEDVSSNDFGAPGTEGKYSNEPVVSGNQVDGYTVANTYTPYTVSLKVTKNWNDDELQALAGKGYDRPESVAVKLSANKGGATYANIALSDDNTWTHTWAKLPRYAAVAGEGGTVTYEPITYTITEVAGDTPQGYIVTYKLNGTATANEGADAPQVNASTLGATEQYKAEVEVTNTPNVADKVEADIVLHKIDSVTGKNIAGVQFELKKGDTVKGTYTTDTQGVAHINFSEIAASTSDTYTLTEKAPATGYEASDAVYTIEVSSAGIQSIELEHTNKNIFEKLYDLIVGGDNPDYNAATHVLTVENTPKASDVTVTKRFVDENGVVIPHEVLATSGYKMNVSYTKLKGDGTGEKVTAALDLPNSSTNGTYTWTLEDVVAGTDVHVHEQNYRNVTGYDFQNVAVTAENVTAETHTDDANFTMPDVSAAGSGSGDSNNNAAVNPGMGGGLGGLAMSAGAAISDVDLSLPAAVANPGIPTANGDVRVSFTNTYKQQVGTLNLIKVWDDADDQDGKRPDSVTFTITAKTDGGSNNANVFGSGSEATNVKTVTFEELDFWEKSEVNLPLYYNGKQVTYYVAETSTLPEGYSIFSGDGVGYTLEAGQTTDAKIVNKYTPQTDSLKITKAWNDNGDAAGLRPDSVKFHLYKEDGTSAGVDAKTIAGNATGDALSATWTNLPVYENGEKITYQVVEEAVTGYTTTYVEAQTLKLDGNTTAAPQTITVTNTLVAETTSITVTKHWNDGNNVDGVRAAATVTLYESVYDKTSKKYGRPAPTTQTDTLAVTDNSEVTFDNLPAIKNGKPVMYSVVETQVPGYEAPVVTGNQVDGYIVTNTHVPETTTAMVTKSWSDNDNASGTRPDAVTMHLYKKVGDADPVDTGKFVTLSKDDGWTHTVAGLAVHELVNTAAPGNAPVYESQEVSYFWKEDVPAGYTASSTEPVASPATITNTAIVDDLKVTKGWSDNGNAAGMRPNSVKFHLYKENGTSAGVDAKTVNVATNWAATWENLPVYDKNGEKITYKVVEEAVAGYTTTYAAAQTIELDGVKTREATQEDVSAGAADAVGDPIAVAPQEVTVTNTLAAETTSVTVTKSWNDGNNVDGARPDSVTVKVYEHVWDKTANENAGGYVKNNEAVHTFTLDEDGNWTGTKDELPAVKKGKPVMYSVAETTVPTGYTAVVTGNQVDGFTVTNTHTPAKGCVEVQKVWDDNNNQDGKRATVTVTLKANGDTVGAKTISADINTPQSAAWHNLPVYKDGEKITYTVEEAAIAGYTTTYSDNSEGVQLERDGDTKTLTVTNRHVPEKTTLTVTKKWNDGGNSDGMRADVTLHLKGTVAGSNLTLTFDDKTIAKNATAADNAAAGTATWTDLPVYHDGKAIAYEVTEEAVPGYSVSGGTITTNETTGAMTAELLNTRTPDTVPATITKTWNDADLLGINGYTRPDSVTVHVVGKDADGNVLYEGDVTLTAGDASADDSAVWTSSVDLPATVKGKTVTYTANEVVPGGFTDNTQTENNLTPNVSIEVTNTPKVEEEITPQPITVVKTDEKSGDLLNGAKFTLTDPHGNKFTETTGEKGEDGKVTFTLDAVGAWTLVETGVPENHKLGDVYSWIITTKVDGDSVKIEKVTEDENTFWKKIKGLFVDLTADGFDKPTNTLTVENPPIGEKTITYLDPNPEDTSDVTTVEKYTIKVGEDEHNQPGNPTRDSYNFGGWLREMDGDGNVIYKANWIKIPDPGEKAIHYVDPAKPEGEQTVLREVIKRDANEPPQPGDPTRDGWKFIGWKRTFDSETGDVTYTATWEEIPPAERVTVTYDPANGEDAKTQTINRNENEPSQPADPTRNGFAFVGWQRVEDKNGNVTYTAKWKEVHEAERIIITYDFGNGEDKVETTIERGENEPAQPGDPMRDGYEFAGWDRTVDPATGNVTYKARWKKVELTDSVTVTYDPANGASATSTTIERGDNEPGQPENPTREGYIFGGWLRQQDPETGNVTYTANWIDTTMCPAPTPTLSDDPSPQTIWVTYVDPDGTTVYMEKTTIAKGAQEPPAPDNPMRNGQVFGGWDRSEDEDGNITYMARWKTPDTPMPPDTPNTPPNKTPTVSERPLTTTPLSNTGGAVGTTGMAAFMLAILGGGLLALRRQRELSEE